MEEKALQEFIMAAGVIAEVSLIFHRACITAGATKEEAYTLTRAFIATYTQNNPGEKKED